MLNGVVIDDAELINERLLAWVRSYNSERPHGALGGQTPYERLRQKTKARGVTGHRQSHKRAEEGVGFHHIVAAGGRGCLKT